MSSDDIAFEDALPLLKAAPPQEEVAVIGGQALNFWAERFRDRFVEFMPFTSGDLDLMGDAVAAAEYARAWGGKLLLPEPFAPVPVSAAVEIEFAGKKRIVQFLKGVYGLSDREARRSCVLVRTGGVDLRVLDPVGCLESRVHNLYNLPGRNDASGIKRVRLAIGVAREHIAGVCATDERAALKMTERVLALARYQDGLKLYVDAGLDLLDVIPSTGLPSAFYEQRLARATQWLSGRRDQYAALVARAPAAGVDEEDCGPR